MEIYARLFQSILVMGGLLLAAMALRRQGVLNESHGQMLAATVTELVLPAVIFSSLATHPVTLREGLLPLVMVGAELVSIAVAWFIGRRLRLDRPQLGALVLCSAFGSSALLGYAMVAEVYRGNAVALSGAVVVSELGVGVTLFTLGVGLAMHFGSGGLDARREARVVRDFFISPIFLALAAGLAWPWLGVGSDSWLAATLFAFLQAAGQALQLLVAFIIGLMLKPIPWRRLLALTAVAGTIKLVFQPLLAAALIAGFGVPFLWRDVLVLEAAMPAATLAAVFSLRYGCDGTLASSLVVATTVLSAGTLLAIYGLAG